MNIKCKYCQSENVYFSKKRGLYVCEDCEKTFELEETVNKQKIFLSYGHDENKEIVDLIYNRLKERGHDPWIDTSNIKSGDDWRQEITNGIADSEDFLAFISNHSVRNPGVCLDEISIGVGNWNTRIQPIFLEKDVEAPNSICNIQWIDLTDWKKYRHSSNWDEYFEGKLEEIYSAVEDEYGHMVRGNISTLQKILHPLMYNIKMRMILQNEIVIRDWLFKKVNDFISDSHDEKVLMIYGRPGTGKSIISAYLSNYNPSCVASFFFEWNNDLTKDFRKLLFSIIFQLGASIVDYQSELIKFLKNNDIDKMSNDEIISLVIYNLLNNLIDGGRENRVIALDGLDEASDKDEEFLSKLQKLISSTPRWIKFVITSRPETNIQEKLFMAKKLVLDDYIEETKKDIKEYISKYISDQSVIDKIVDKSEGSFVYASETVKIYKSNPLEFDIDSIPQGLFGIYYSNFERLFPDINEYKEIYKKFFELLIVAKEQLKVEDIKSLLSIDEEKVKGIIKKLSSYIVALKYKGNIYLEIYHKSFWDFLTSEVSGKYQISINEGNKLFKDYILKEVDNDNSSYSVYIMKYAYEHISRVERESLDIKVELKLIEKLLSASKLYGDLSKEKYYLDNLKDNYPKSYEYYFSALEYYKKTDGVILNKITNEIYQNIGNIKDEDKAFKMICQISYSYFYIGESKKTYDLMKLERNKHDEKFWLDEMHEAEYWHVISLTAHDLDKNDDVIYASTIDLEKYRKNKNYYSEYITMVNLFDGLMAFGRISEAYKVASQALIYNEDRYYIHVDDILKLCYANLLQTSGRIMEAFSYYEDGLKTAKEIQIWDYLYGSIWRELNLARFYDKTSLNNLLKYRDKSREMGYRYLVALSDTFYIISSYLLNDINVDTLLELYQEVMSMDMPGLILESSITMMTLSLIKIDEELVTSLLSLAQGIKGYPQIVSIFFKKYYGQLSKSTRDMLDNWINIHVKEIIEYEDNFFKDLTKDQPDYPYLSKSICPKCQGKCCYDGIYIEEEEENTIKEFVEKHPHEFEHIIRPYVVDGDWPGMRSTRKTEKVPYDLYDESFPKHFTKTKCCFQMANGECLLQRAATDLQLHPWKIKPKGCWSFPLRFDESDNVIAPLTDKSKDPHYIDESYPGYVTFLPCVKESAEGKSWKEKYKYEIEFLSYLKRK